MGKSIIIYYSYTNHTDLIANKIKERLGFDILRLQPLIPYSDDYNLVVKQGKDEVSNNFKPGIEKININLEKYDTIILGTPVWWYTYAPVVNTFLASTDLSGKKIIPFMTNGGWLGHTLEDIKKMCPSSVVEKAIDIKFGTTNLITGDDEIEAWIASLK